MTVIGVSVMLGARAVLWADTEMMWHNGSSAGHCNKVTVNVAARMACASAGWAEMGIAAKAVASSTATFDQALDEMPDALRITAARYVRRGRVGSDPREYADQVTIVVGWSERYGCMTAFEFAGSAFFAPVITSFATHPSVPDIRALCSIGEVVSVAHAQMRELRSDHPDLGGGRLCVAVLERHQVISGVPYDLTNDIGDGACCLAEGGGSIRQNPCSAAALGAAASDRNSEAASA